MRAIERRCPGQPRKHRRFRERELADVFAEVDLRGSLDAIRAAAVENLVQIELKYAVFGEMLLHHDGKDHFVRLALQGAPRAQVDVSGELLGDCASALAQLLSAQVLPGRASDPPQVHAGMPVEPAVLNCNSRVGQELWDVLERDVDAVFDVDPTQDDTVAGVDDRGFRRPHVPYLGNHAGEADEQTQSDAHARAHGQQHYCLQHGHDSAQPTPAPSPGPVSSCGIRPHV